MQTPCLQVTLSYDQVTRYSCLLRSVPTVREKIMIHLIPKEKKIHLADKVISLQWHCKIKTSVFAVKCPYLLEEQGE